MESEFERLRKEQEKTNEILAELKRVGTLQRFVEEVPETEPEWNENPLRFYDSWDFESLENGQNLLVAALIKEIYEKMGLMKFALNYADNLYRERTEDWQSYREKHPDGWQDYFSNPECLAFFEKYERANSINRSIYKDSRKGKNG